MKNSRKNKLGATISAFLIKLRSSWDHFSSDKSVREIVAIVGATLYFSLDFTKAVFIRIFETIGMNNSVATTVTSFVPLLFIIPLILIKVKQVRLFFITYGLIALYFLLSFLINRQYSEYFTRPLYGVARVFRPDGGIFAILFLLVLGSKVLIESALKSSAFVLFLMHSLQYVSAKSRGFWVTQNQYGDTAKIPYSLDFGFGMAFVVTLMVFFGLKTKKWFYYVLAAIGYVMVLDAGNRMAIVLTPAFLIFMYLHKRIVSCAVKKDYIKLALQVVSILLFVVVIVLVAPHVLRLFVSTFGIDVSQSRTLQMILNNELFADTGRSRIHQLVWSALKQNPVFGLGAFGDRPHVAPYYVWGHSHGFFYEVWSNLGLLLGIPFVLLIIYALYFFLTSKQTQLTGIYFVFFSMNLVHLTSYSFWISPYVWSALTIFAIEFRRYAAHHHCPLMERIGRLKCWRSADR